MKIKSTIVALISMLLFVMAAMAAPPEVITFNAKKGNVTFKHLEHQKHIGADKCNTCHHTGKADGSDAQKCSVCHGKEPVEKDGKVIPDLKTTKHTTCKNCHKNEQKGPTKCEGCHASADAATAH